MKKKVPSYVKPAPVGRRPGAGFMADRRQKRMKTRAARKVRVLRDESR